MISVSNEIMNAMTANNRKWSIKVTVKRNTTDAFQIDISDRVLACDISFDWERRSGSASLELDNYDFSLSPLNQSSTTNQVAGVYDPLLDSNHIVEIWEGILTTTGIQYIKKFTGVLGDEIDVSSYPGTIQLTARDMSKLLQDTYIYQSKTYSPVAQPNLTIAEAVVGDLIATFLPDGNITLAIDDPTNYVIGRPDAPYTAKDINLWDAIQQISDTFNFSLMFDENGVLRLKKVIRDLSTITPVYAFDESKVTKDSLSTSDSDVRNHVMLRVQGLDIIERKNEDSIAKYGRRYFEVHRSMATIITTAEQGHELVDNILKDLSYVVPINKVEMPLFPIIQAGDIVTLSDANLGITSLSHRYRVTSLRDTFSSDRKRTTLTLKGYTTFNPATVPAPKPITNFVGNSSGVIRSIQNYPNSGWTGYTKTISYPLLTWTAPTQDVNNNPIAVDFGGYTIYRKGPSQSQFFPVASVTAYIRPLNLGVNYWHDYSALPGVNQYKIVAINKFGKTSAESSVVTLTKPNDTIT